MRRRLATFGGIAIPAPAGVAALWLAGSFSESPITFLMAALLNLVLFTPGCSSSFGRLCRQPCVHSTHGLRRG